MPLPLERRARAEPYFRARSWLVRRAKRGTATVGHHQRALDALQSCDEIGAQLPKGRAHLRHQLERSATSIVANIAEGAGEFSPSEKARFYRLARRSAIETFAWIELTARRGEAPEPVIQTTLRQLEQVVSMLVALIKNCDR